MKKISKWAHRHPMTARLIITISHLLIIANGLLAGFFLFLNDWQHASFTLFILMASFTLLVIFYPERRQKTGLFKHSYRTQKTFDFGLVFFSFLMISVGSNNWLVKNVAVVNTSSPTATFIVHKQKKISKRQLRKQIRKELRALKKEFKKRKNNAGVIITKVILTLLILLGSVALGGLVAVLSCHLSCSGNQGMAVAVLIVGFLGIVLLGLSAIIKLWRKNVLSN